MMFRAIPITLALITSMLLACDSDKGPSAKEQAAATKEAEKKQQEEAALAKRKADREAKKTAEKAKEKLFNDALDAVALVPEGEALPKDLVKACDDVAAAQDAFMERLQKGDALEQWKAGKETKLPMTKIQCTQGNSVKIAVCQKHGLDKAEEVLKDASADIFRRCIDKYRAKGKGAPGTIRAKPK
jgi:hypothetical protein